MLRLYLPQGQRSSQMYSPDKTVGEAIEKLYMTRCVRSLLSLSICCSLTSRLDRT